MTGTAKRLEVALDCRADLGEGAWWDVESQRLLWLDLFDGSIHRFDPRSGIDGAFNVGQPVGMIAGRRGGGLVAAVRDGVGFVDLDAETFEMVLDIEVGNPANRANDGACDAQGRLWFGTMAYDQTPAAGTVYRVDADLSVTAQIAGTTTSNGIDWSPDGRLMYFADTATGRIDVLDFDLDSGTVRNRRGFASTPANPGLPDGLTVDAEGDVWVAMWDGYAVIRYAPDGRIREVIDIPVARVTSVAFGGAGLDQLFITTARNGRSAAELASEPHAGSIFRLEPGVTGLAPHSFAG